MDGAQTHFGLTLCTFSACNGYLLIWDYNGQARHPLQAQNMQTGSKVCMGSTKMCLVSLDTSWTGKRAIAKKQLKRGL